MKTLLTILAFGFLATSLTSCGNIFGDYKAYDAGVSYINQKDSLEIEYKKAEIENKRFVDSMKRADAAMLAKIDSITNLIK